MKIILTIIVACAIFTIGLIVRYYTKLQQEKMINAEIGVKEVNFTNKDLLFNK